MHMPLFGGFCLLAMNSFTIKSSQVRSGMGAIRRSSASPRPSCDGTPSSSVWTSPRQTSVPPCPYPSDKTPPDAACEGPIGIIQPLATRQSRIRWVGSTIAESDPTGGVCGKTRQHGEWLDLAREKVKNDSSSIITLPPCRVTSISK